MNVTVNPFTNRGVITDPADFFGREAQINDIMTRLSTMQSASIVGERRIGKSSLLYHLAQTGAQRLGNANYRLFYVDLQDAHFHTAVGFFQAVLTKLGASSAAITSEKTLNQNLIAFSDQIETLERLGQRVVLCLDEFENTFKHPDQFTGDVFDHLRSQLSTRKMAFVTATQHTLQQLSLEGRLTSPFYNIFTVFELKEFTEAEADEFIAVQDQKVNFTEPELEFIYSYFELHPLKLQILCDWVFKNRQNQFNEWVLAEKITGEFNNFFVETLDPRQFFRLKKVVSLDNIKKLLETVKAGRELIKGG